MDDTNGQIRNRAFPYLATLPQSCNLALARRWHLTFAWVFAVAMFAYLARSLVNRHVQRDLLPTRQELRPSHVWSDIEHHARLKFPTGEAARRYNVLQKFAYPDQGREGRHGSVRDLFLSLLWTWAARALDFRRGQG